MTYQDKTGSLMANTHPGGTTGQDAFNDMLVTAMAQGLPKRLTPITTEAPAQGTAKSERLSQKTSGGGYKQTGRKYMVRRLTELECSRLQGLPDCEGKGWACIPPMEHAEETDIDYWEPFWDEWCEINGTPKKSRKFIRKWLESPISGSSQYKIYGNGIATPQWFYTCEGIKEQYEGTGHVPTMASLFDGSGSFPYIWETLNGKGTAIWGSEVDPTPMLVSIYRINGRYSGE